MLTITWSELGSPKKPDDIPVERLGVVSVKQENIDLVKEMGGDPEFELLDASAMGDSGKRYVLGLARKQ